MNSNEKEKSSNNYGKQAGLSILMLPQQQGAYYYRQDNGKSAKV